MMTYKEAYDKIIDAYFKDEIKPTDTSFCFCGTLCDNTPQWYEHVGRGEKTASHGYSGKELYRMEKALMMRVPLLSDIKDEEKVFKGMCAALEVLKQIHKKRGENVDEVPNLTKRKLIAK